MVEMQVEGGRFREDDFSRALENFLDSCAEGDALGFRDELHEAARRVEKGRLFVFVDPAKFGSEVEKRLEAALRAGQQPDLMPQKRAFLGKYGFCVIEDPVSQTASD